MKKLILSLVGAFALMLIPIASASAAPEPVAGTTFITGTITQADHVTPVSLANVTVTCDSHVLNSTTTNAGGYIVQFSSTDCPAGATATVVATKGGSSGDKSKTVNNLTSSPTVINLTIVDVSLPELGLLTGVGAAILGGGAFLLIRRRSLSGKAQ